MMDLAAFPALLELSGMLLLDHVTHAQPLSSTMLPLKNASAQLLLHTSLTTHV